MLATHFPRLLLISILITSCSHAMDVSSPNYGAYITKKDPAKQQFNFYGQAYYKDDFRVHSSSLTPEQQIEANTNLIVACKHGDADKAKELLEAGANPSATDKKKFSALIYAAYNNHPACVRHLIAHRVKLNYVPHDGWSALHWAAKKGDAQMLGLLCDAGADPDILNNAVSKLCPLLLAACHGHYDCVDALLIRKVKPNEQNRRGWTPLMAAAKEGYKKIVERLLDAGADWTLRMPESFADAQSLAWQNDHKEIVAIFDALPKKEAVSSKVGDQGW